MCFKMSNVCLISGIWLFSLWINNSHNLLFYRDTKFPKQVITFIIQSNLHFKTWPSAGLQKQIWQRGHDQAAQLRPQPPLGTLWSTATQQLSHGTHVGTVTDASLLKSPVEIRRDLCPWEKFHLHEILLETWILAFENVLFAQLQIKTEAAEERRDYQTKG